MLSFLRTMCLIHAFGNIFCLLGPNKNPEAHMNSEIIAYWGYPSEEFEVKTDDGYILPINRIRHGKNNAESSVPKMVVFCLHGLFATPGAWVSNPPNNSLAFILADAGYDVWLGSSRGSTWAKKHVTLNSDSKEYWDFSFDQMIKHDLPATIDFILEKTGQKQIYYIGHSQGTLIAIGAFATNQELAEKIKLNILLAPIYSVKHVKGAGHLGSYISLTAIKLLFGEKEFVPTVVSSEVGGYICDINLADVGCAAMMGFMGGYSPEQLNMSRIDVYVKLNLAGTSVKILIHYVQAIRSGVLRAFDWGSPSLNMQHYNQTTPPVYNVEDMKVPTAIFTGLKDFLSDPEDVEILKPKIPNLIYLKTLPDFSHFDFILGLNARKEISEEILTILRKYDSDIQL
ncbi:LOW QUALITY PROTEIN: tear acid lipase-like protein [Mastomys coucha]|uniref:LOW QUALITY PROTEIN: tear acid lipase-like protein n=1 Tax=Mastomys coucha TaxID=35658 RepID=UPI001261E46C|nr:LOW QUALITY PROTEIN: tear acid lipase-like protein [Mastomys coucha]